MLQEILTYMDRVKQNLDLATDVYMERVNKCPCRESVIHLYKGSDSTKFQEMLAPLTVYLKGSKRKKHELEQEHPTLFAYFNTVSDVQQRHEVVGFPSQYSYLLVCCFQQGCPHPLCQHGKSNVPMEWFPGGPSVNSTPIPVPDPDLSWGNDHCQKCSGFCTGHFLQPEKAFMSKVTPMTQPLSSQLKDFYAAQITKISFQTV